MRGRIREALAAMLLGTTAVAQAQAPAVSVGNPTAEALYQAGKQAMHEQRYEVACPKLAASHQLQPSGGTALLLARCWDEQGRLATAWAAWGVALGLAVRDHQDERIKVARKRIAELEARLPRLRLQVREPSPSLDLRLDGQPLPAAAWDVAVPVDPGAHELVASAEGREARTLRFSAPDEARLVDLEIAPLALVVPVASSTPSAPVPLPAPAVSAPRLASSSSAPLAEAPARTSLRVPIAHASLGAGAVVLVLGTSFGLVALGKAREADQICPGRECTSSRALDLTGQARTASAVANVGIGLGLGLGVLGGVLLALGPSQSSLALVPGGVSARLRF